MPCTNTQQNPKRPPLLYISRSSIRNALLPPQVMSDTHVLESKPFTSGALENSNHRGPGVPWPKISGATTSSLGGSTTFTRRQIQAKVCPPRGSPIGFHRGLIHLLGTSEGSTSWRLRVHHKPHGINAGRTTGDM